MDLKKIIEKGIYNLNQLQITETKNNANSVLRGSNTPLFIEGNFIASEAAHCPRLAIFRSKYGKSETKQESSIISHKTGRVVEEVFKEIIDASAENGLSYLQEEEAQIHVNNEDGKLIFSARPDIIFEQYGKKYTFEMKSIQSSSTYFQVSTEKPKCGAVMQASVYHTFLGIERGYIGYILYYYLDAYNIKTKTRVKSKPTIILFETELRDNGILYVDGYNTIITEQRLKDSIAILSQNLKEDIIPKRPIFMTVFGRPAKYSPCKYCFHSETCDLIDSRRLTKFEEIPSNI